MSQRIRFGVCLEGELVKRFDSEIKKKGYNNRSKAIGDIIRDWLIQEQLVKAEEKEGVGVITLLYNHEVRTTMDALVDLQHSYPHIVIATTHVHLDPHICLEVIIARGKLNTIKEIADHLSPIRGVKQVKLILTTADEIVKK
ncbi:nickel-responsive transcriptional regulator NikR [Candidatus Aerophobetes bacterium]|uniref:Putative nickel-responsive regulator n=1 Tax=Aerophobetes bacterium TaxID=2030807 RepID=A0A662DI82_UNCAE|nr:MAG: nickel-responsive transcriptional regulator NikR [Candidatus Aerophobetes bacterium]